MQDMQLLSAFHEAGAVAGGDDVKNGMTYDQEFAYEGRCHRRRVCQR